MTEPLQVAMPRKPDLTVPIGDGLEVHFWGESLMTIGHDRLHRHGGANNLIAIGPSAVVGLVKARIEWERSRRARGLAAVEAQIDAFVEHALVPFPMDPDYCGAEASVFVPVYSEFLPSAGPPVASQELTTEGCHCPEQDQHPVSGDAGNHEESQS